MAPPRPHRLPLLARPWALPVLLALRYGATARKQAFTRLLSWLAMVGIALGVAALILVQAALAGFQALLKGQVLARTPQVEVTVPADADLEAAEASLAAVPGVSSQWRVISGRAWLVTLGRVVPVEVIGYSGSVPPTFPGAAGAEPGLYLSARLARLHGLERGSPVEVISPRPTLTPLGPQPRSIRLPLAGTFEGAASDEGERVALPLAAAERLFAPARPRFEVDAGGLDEAVALAPLIAGALPGAEVRTWREINRGLLFALALEKRITFVAVLLVVIVASLSLVAALSLLIASKKVELGILGTMGAEPRLLLATFLALGALLAGLGTSAGALLGVGLAWLFDATRLITVPGDVFFVRHVPFRLEPMDLAATVGLSLALALGAALYAARRVLLLDPIEAIRR
ncbi:MAG TPA: FtsX-like permease family protein [Thermoanaerobaculia bacterium]|nr:FtsX-like permease family protein [Thermoanaerobaculia bacterium]